MGNDDEMLTLIGPEAFVALTEKLGGDRFYFGRVPTTVLVEAVGDVAARQLTERYGGEQPLIPLARAYRAQFYRRAGEGNRQIARRLGLTLRGIERLLKADPREATRRRVGPSQQMNLFD